MQRRLEDFDVSAMVPTHSRCCMHYWERLAIIRTQSTVRQSANKPARPKASGDQQNTKRFFWLSDFQGLDDAKQISRTAKLLGSRPGDPSTNNRFTSTQRFCNQINAKYWHKRFCHRLEVEIDRENLSFRQR